MRSAAPSSRQLRSGSDRSARRWRGRPQPRAAAVAAAVAAPAAVARGRAPPRSRRAAAAAAAAGDDGRELLVGLAGDRRVVGEAQADAAALTVDLDDA